MTEPVVVPRSEHGLSRKSIDPDALSVLYRLHRAGHVAYLVGGSVRDLLLGRQPKDFDIGTSAHPYQVKRLFRNCWVVGRRFRLAHVRFGTKAIEVATFRSANPDDDAKTPAGQEETRSGPVPTERERAISRDNTFGTPEQDAYRRDFTVNALFYDIATLSIIDYVHGLDDLGGRVIRSIGDPDARFHEDPVRMLRALVLASRLDFDIDPPVEAAIARCRSLIATAAPARLMEEAYKVLRSGRAAAAFVKLARSGLLGAMSPELEQGMARDLPTWLAALDAYRRAANPATPLPNAVLVGTLLAPLGLVDRSPRPHVPAADDGSGRSPVPRLGVLPPARRDVQRLGHILQAQRRLLDLGAPLRSQRAVMAREVFDDALLWLRIHGGTSEVVAYWDDVAARYRGAPAEPAPAAKRRRRRRRRSRSRPAASTSK